MKQSILICSAALSLCIPLSACDPSPSPALEPRPQDLFFERLSLLCGKAYAGTLVSEQEADVEMANKPMIMHAASCDHHEIQIPFHIAEGQDTWDRSRTWIITRTDRGLRCPASSRTRGCPLLSARTLAGGRLDSSAQLSCCWCRC